ncbi:MAG: asparagine synthetase B [Candidatus Nanopelagicales bacterium]|nr:asparagine synthetase B [Candidatus Nanopelagicales bacterium]MDZ4248967.1 asparagine synthetase B [Candidatus Nanopelagicales bacterium]
MCGVCGATGRDDAARAYVADAASLLRHRGPDGESYSAEPYAFLGHTRLAIIDIAGGAQPFVSRDGRFSVVYNGEIYNHKSLRRTLDLECTACDGAVLPALWARFGTSSLDLLRGMFAICVSDRQDGTLTLAVDPLGLKPLYWCRAGDGSLRFASEMLAVARSLPSVTIDRPALSAYLDTGRFPLGSSGVSEIRRMLPGEWLRFSADGALVGRGQARIPITQGPSTWKAVVDEFIRSVELHLEADVPTGLMLSSGVDSAAIAWAASQLDMRVESFTVAMSGTNPESELACRIARRFGHAHTVLAADPDQALVDDFLQSIDRPTTDGLNTFLVCRAAARAGLKVILAGTGGDELLLGYPHHLRATRVDWPRRPSSHVSRAAARTLATLPLPRGRARARRYGEYGAPRSCEDVVRLARAAIPPSLRTRLLQAQPLPDPTGTPVQALVDGTAASRVTAAEFDQYLMPMLLADADTFSMANSVEERTPLVDAGFVSAIAALPQRQVGKGDFVAETADPELMAALTRPKVGFVLPMNQWMRSGPLAPSVQGAFGERSQVRGLLDRRALEAVHRQWLSGRSAWQSPWAIVVLDRWLEKIADVTAWQ